jgi:hypothetical protein
VRATAAESLGSYKLIYQQAASALEKAETDDPDKAVRAAAKAARWQYGLNGYKPAASTAKGQSAEPPLAKPGAKPVSPGTAAKPAPPEVPFRTITQGPTSTAPLPAPTAEPPLAKTAAKPEPKPLPTSVAPPAPSVPQRMPATVPQQMPSKVEPPQATLPVPPLPTEKKSPLPLPGVPTVPGLPQPASVPTVQPPK